MIRIFKRLKELLDVPQPEAGKALGWNSQGEPTNIDLTLPIASSSTAGIVKAGLGVDVENDGTISAAGPIAMFKQSVTADTLIPEGYNALSVGPVTIANDKVVTVSDNSLWRII